MIGKRAKMGAWGDPPNFVAPVKSNVLGGLGVAGARPAHWGVFILSGIWCMVLCRASAEVWIHPNLKPPNLKPKPQNNTSSA